MQGREYLRPATMGSANPSLPFALFGAAVSAEPPPSAIVARLDLLQHLAQENRSQVEHLRHESAEILHRLASPTASVGTAVRSPSEAPAVAEEPAPLCLYLFGTFEVRAGSKAVSRWTSRKSRLLLAYLAMDPKRLVPRDVLIELFWPDSSLKRGSNNLSIAIFQIRAWLKRVLPGENHGVCVRQGLYSLDPDTPCWVDVEEFRNHWAEARTALHRQQWEAARHHLASAVGLYRGDFMESDPYEEWTVEPRRTFSESYRWGLAWLAADAAGRGDWPGVGEYAKEIVQRDACDEEGHRWLIRAYVQMGRRSQALLQYRICSERLREELGVSPSEETEELFLAINGPE